MSESQLSDEEGGNNFFGKAAGGTDMELSRRGRGSVGDATNNERFIGLVIFCCFLLLTFILVLATTDPSKDLQLRMPAKTRIPLKDDEVTKVLILAYPRYAKVNEMKKSWSRKDVCLGMTMDCIF